MTLTFNPERHEYATEDGRIVPHVTGILQAVGIVDATWFTEWARERGSAVHRALHYLDEGDLDPASVDPRLAGYVSAWQTFLAETGWQMREIEHPVHSELYDYGGTLDRVFYTGQVFGVLDIKTGAPDDATGIQLAAYGRAYYEETGRALPYRIAVHLHEDGSYVIVPYTNPNDINVFLAACAVVNWRMQHGRA